MFKKLLILISLPLLLIGCSSNPAVGTWTASGAMGSVTMTLKSDKTFATTMNVNGNTAPFASGTYEVNGKQITLKTSQVGATQLPSMAANNDTGTISDDGKTLSLSSGINFTKQ